MEISQAYQADIRHIQNQLKIAIQNHQIIVKKLEADPTNMHIKLQLKDIQKHIMSLSETQKRIVERLRKEIQANNNTTISIKPLAEKSINNNNNNIVKTNGLVKPQEIKAKKTDVQSKYAKGGSVGSSSASSSAESPLPSDDSEETQEVGNNSNIKEKINFLSALGLATRDAIAELQNRRVERKRRSTANHTQFVYGNNWDVSKRKKSTYLQTVQSPQPTTRQMARSQQQSSPASNSTSNTVATTNITTTATLAVAATAAAKTSATSSTTEITSTTSTTNTSATSIVSAVGSRESSSSPVPLVSRTIVQSSDNSKLRIAGLPNSLTIEKINSPPQVCLICRKSGLLSVCNNCSSNFHPVCLSEVSQCPNCKTKQGSPTVAVGIKLSDCSDSVTIQQKYVPNQNVDILERKAEKARLEQINSRLNFEKCLMEQRAAELTISLEAQATHRKELLENEEAVRKKIQVINDFVTIIKSPHPTPS